jgi:hypothetical protein
VPPPPPLTVPLLPLTVPVPPPEWLDPECVVPEELLPVPLEWLAPVLGLVPLPAVELVWGGAET